MIDDYGGDEKHQCHNNPGNGFLDGDGNSKILTISQHNIFLVPQN